MYMDPITKNLVVIHSQNSNQNVWSSLSYEYKGNGLPCNGYYTISFLTKDSNGILSKIEEYRFKYKRKQLKTDDLSNLFRIPRRH